MSTLALFLLGLFGTVLNRLLFRFALVPMGQMTHLFSIYTNASYLAFFGAVLRLEQAKGTSFVRELRFLTQGDGRLLALGAGISECVGFTLMPLAVRNLPGSILAVVAQSMVAFTMVLSYSLLGKRFDSRQVLGVCVVLTGICISTYPKYTADGSLDDHSGTNLLQNIGILLLSYFFVSLCFVLKELAFKRLARELLRKGLESELKSGFNVRMNFATNFVAALWQGLLLWCLWPLNFMYITPLSRGEYFRRALAVLRDQQEMAIVVLYIAANLFYLVVTVTVIRRMSAVIAVLVGSLAVPLCALAFCFDWPGLPAERFSWHLPLGLLVIGIGIALYNHKQISGTLERRPSGSRSD
eukprot:TRINITY_DN26586_c0_g1_i2.p1 TRINITY_DN26586_c0_g1~~TRINITY_DN26586_c0_g1_i2.p1  ORF type:complete len:355 (-),score=77.37 TRINITY_DN26586_c0_g1_i2:232-1296(-)